MRGRKRTIAQKVRRGFSLVEMLLALAVISILATMVGTALQGVLQSGLVTQAMEDVNAELSLARQGAGVRNREHEVRFYRYARPDHGELKPEFRAFQIISLEAESDPEAADYAREGDDGFRAKAVPLDRVRRLPEGTIFIDDPEYSTLLTDSSREQGVSNVNLPGDVSAEYAYFRFKPEGGTDLDLKAEWILTLGREGEADAGNLRNFAMLKIDPYTGRLRWFRP